MKNGIVICRRIVLPDNRIQKRRLIGSEVSNARNSLSFIDTMANSSRRRPSLQTKEEVGF